MSITMYSASVPVFVKLYGNLASWLDKAEAHAQAKKFDSKVLVSTRLAPDMLPFSSQIQIACDGPKLGVARIAGVEAPKHEDTETTLAELKQRVESTVAFIQSVPADKIVGTEDKDINVPRRAGIQVMKGEFYLKHFVFPNFYFHLTTAYALLRHNGVEIGKRDYLGDLS